MVTREVKIIRQKITIPRSGQSLVEFAIVLPLLVLILLFVIDLGRAFYSLIAITNAAREGARWATFYPDDLQGIKDHAVKEGLGSGITINEADVIKSCPEIMCISGKPVMITVKYQYKFIFFDLPRAFGFYFVPEFVTFTRSVQMMIQ